MPVPRGPQRTSAMLILQLNHQAPSAALTVARLPKRTCAVCQSPKVTKRTSAMLILLLGPQALSAALTLWPDYQKDRLLSRFCGQSPKTPKRASVTMILHLGPSSTVCCFDVVARLPKRTSAVWILWPESQGPQNNVSYFDFAFRHFRPSSTVCCLESLASLLKRTSVAWILWPESQGPQKNACYFDFAFRSLERVGYYGFVASQRLLFQCCCQGPKALQRTTATLILLLGPSSTVCCFDVVARLSKKASAVWILWPKSEGPQKSARYFDFAFKHLKHCLLLWFCGQTPKKNICCLDFAARVPMPPKERLLLDLISGPSSTVCCLDFVARLPKRTSGVWILLPESEGPQKKRLPLCFCCRRSNDTRTPKQRQAQARSAALALCPEFQKNVCCLDSAAKDPRLL